MSPYMRCPHLSFSCSREESTLVHMEQLCTAQVDLPFMSWGSDPGTRGGLHKCWAAAWGEGL
jgi:hypothetical protein